MRTVDVDATARNIKMLLANNKFTCQSVADVLMVDKNSVSKWRRGINLPTIDNLVMLADILGIGIEDVVITKEIGG